MGRPPQREGEGATHKSSHFKDGFDGLQGEDAGNSMNHESCHTIKGLRPLQQSLVPKGPSPGRLSKRK